jgi:hypothetical protein
MSRTREARPGPGAPCPPGTAAPARPRTHPVTAACRLAAAGPCHPGTTTRPGMFFSQGISKGSPAFAPPALPSPVTPGRTGSPWLHPGFTPGRAGPSRARQGAGGPQALARGNVAAIISGLLPRRSHSQRATSRRNARRRALQSGKLLGVVTRNLPEPGRFSPLKPRSRAGRPRTRKVRHHARHQARNRKTPARRCATALIQRPW